MSKERFTWVPVYRGEQYIGHDLVNDQRQSQAKIRLCAHGARCQSSFKLGKKKHVFTHMTQLDALRLTSATLHLSN